MINISQGPAGAPPHLDGSRARACQVWLLFALLGEDGRRDKFEQETNNQWQWSNCNLNKR